jgi:hypothetical protein
MVQRIEAVLDLKTDIQKDPSASTKPVTHQGFNIEVLNIISLLIFLYLTCLGILFFKLKRLSTDTTLIQVYKVIIIKTINNK